MRRYTQRKAFSMLTTIFVIVIMASVGAMVMSLSGKMVESTTTQFQREQSMLLAKSYTEYAIMAVMANGDRTNNCLNTINGVFNPYTITVNISYIGDNTTLTGTNCSNVLSNTAATEPFLNIIVDAYVSYPNENDQNITYHKRTLQKI